jgi:hypothetical protein
VTGGQVVGGDVEVKPLPSFLKSDKILGFLERLVLVSSSINENGGKIERDEIMKCTQNARDVTKYKLFHLRASTTHNPTTTNKIRITVHNFTIFLDFDTYWI